MAASGGNGGRKMLVRIIEMVIMSAIVGGITLYGNSRVIETRLESVCNDLHRVERTVNKMTDKFDQHMDKYHWGIKP